MSDLRETLVSIFIFAIIIMVLVVSFKNYLGSTGDMGMLLLIIVFLGYSSFSQIKRIFGSNYSEFSNEGVYFFSLLNRKNTHFVQYNDYQSIRIILMRNLKNVKERGYPLDMAFVFSKEDIDFSQCQDQTNEQFKNICYKKTDHNHFYIYYDEELYMHLTKYLSQEQKEILIADYNKCMSELLEEEEREMI